MKQHIAFWLGVFVTTLLVVPILLGALASSDETLRSIATLSFVVLATLIVSLVVVLLLKDRILRAFGLKSEASIFGVANKASEVAQAAMNKDKQSFKKHSGELIESGLHWYAWSNFYRWVISTALAIILVFGGIAGAMLLLEQNKLIAIQNKNISDQTEQMVLQSASLETQTAIDRLTLVSSISERLLGETRTLPATGLRYWINTPATLSSCEQEQIAIRYTGGEMQTVPSPPEIKILADLTDSKYLGEIVTNHLISLLSDHDSRVRLGALLALDQAGKLPKNTNLIVQDTMISRLKINSAVRLQFHNSQIVELDCPNCQINAANSILIDNNVKETFSTLNSFVISGVERETLVRKTPPNEGRIYKLSRQAFVHPKRADDSIFVWMGGELSNPGELRPQKAEFYVMDGRFEGDQLKERISNATDENGNLNLTNFFSRTQCESIESFCEQNKMFDCQYAE